MAGTRATAVRRVLAFGIDYLVLAAYAGALTAIAFASGAADAEPPGDIAGKVRGHATALLTFTVPVVLYFAVAEAVFGATLGKRLLGLRVAGVGGPRFRSTLVRNVVKFAPWELAHVGVWYGPGRPFLDPPGLLSHALFLLSLAAAAVWAAGVFLGSGRTVYDRAGGTQVVEGRESV